ncbi:type II restriction endonuclease [Rufibacter immobilis]|nr:type II restriction endonuclease [Rufibacter immobilis]
MATPIGDRAIEDAQAYGKAILKYISPNDLGLTGGHQKGYYLPKAVWELFTPNPPIKGVNAKSWPSVLWQDGTVTESCITWYGTGTRSEYRLTRFGREFLWLTPDNLGSLLVLIPISHTEMRAYVLDIEDDILDIQSSLGIEIEFGKNWAAYIRGEEEEPETESECIERKFREFTTNLDAFPTSGAISTGTQRILLECLSKFNQLSLDKKIMELVDFEYKLFKRIERLLLQDQIVRVFSDVDDFVATANSITNRRKSRAGHSFEHHTEFLLRLAGIPFESQAKIEGNKKPDILIPSKEAYEDSKYPAEKLRMIGIKTTCKDRWRQVLNEANRVPNKHIITMQKGISSNQLQEMEDEGVTLVVPQDLHTQYPPEWRSRIKTLEEFVSELKADLEIGDGRTQQGTAELQYVPNQVQGHQARNGNKAPSSQLGLSF